MFGIAYNLLESHHEIRAIQPGLAENFAYAGFTPDWVNVVDPKLWLKHLRDQFISGGGLIEQKEARSLSVTAHKAMILCDGEQISSDHVVVAAGAWSKSLAQAIGDKIPLETERGYNTTFDSGDFQLRTHLTFADHGFVVSKVGTRVRVGGAVELGVKRTAQLFACA